MNQNKNHVTTRNEGSSSNKRSSNGTKICQQIHRKILDLHNIVNNKYLKLYESETDIIPQRDLCYTCTFSPYNDHNTNRNSNFVPRPETRLVFLTEGSFCGSKTPRGAPAGSVFDPQKDPEVRKTMPSFCAECTNISFHTGYKNGFLVCGSIIIIINRQFR